MSAGRTDAVIADATQHADTLELWAEDDVLAMRRELALHNTVHPQCIEAKDLETWAEMLRTAARHLRDLIAECARLREES